MRDAHDTVISTQTLADALDQADWAIVDCRFDLANPEAGEAAYRRAHIPGAVYAHLDRDLSGPVVPGQTGRHPLPDVAAIAATLGRWGIDERTQVVAYDDRGGAFAARLWWQLRQLGHDAVAVLDGGWPAWVAEGRPARSGSEVRAARTFSPRPRPELLADEAAVIASLRAGGLVLDARGVERYRGEVEPIDTVAGHIPGAVSAPFAENLDTDGRFLSRDALRARFEALTGDHPAAETIYYCGSGVTGTHDLLAAAYADLPLGRLYAPSWSGWIADPRRPVATGAAPGTMPEA